MQPRYMDHPLLLLQIPFVLRYHLVQIHPLDMGHTWKGPHWSSKGFFVWHVLLVDEVCEPHHYKVTCIFSSTMPEDAFVHLRLLLLQSSVDELI